MKVKQVYECEVCGKILVSLEQAEEHERIPVTESFPLGLVLKQAEYISGPNHYLFLGKKLNLDGRHNRIYRCYHLSLKEGKLWCFDSDSKTNSSIKKAFDEDNINELSYLTISEFEKISPMIKKWVNKREIPEPVRT